jgi:hypothetical protein
MSEKGNKNPVTRTRFIVLRMGLGTLKVFSIKTTSLLAAKRIAHRHFGRPELHRCTTIEGDQCHSGSEFCSFFVWSEEEFQKILVRSQLTHKTLKQW